jgi:hypothetical protein
MPIKIDVSGNTMILNPTETFKTIHLKTKNGVVKADPGWYVATMNMTGK